MVYLVSIGVNKNNKGKIGARGWHIWRRGKQVKVAWGAVTIAGNRPKRIEWVGECLKADWGFRTPELAKANMLDRITEKTSTQRKEQKSPYQKLPKGQRIWNAGLRASKGRRVAEKL